ncbi:MAG: SPOR domain-containing protein [Woeseia sp.]
MDRALKERVIGAIVLVVFIVLVVPVFLDGPADDVDVVSETVLLPGQNGASGQERKRQTIVLERDRNEPVPGAVSNEPEVVVEAPPVTVSEPVAKAPPVAEPPPKKLPATVVAEPEPARDETPTPTTAAEVRPSAAAPEAQSSTGMWAVQLGSFSNKANAERLAASLRSQGYAAFLSQLSSSGTQLHRVRIGPQKDRESAEAVAKRLSGEGQKGQVVPHP